MTEYSCVLLSVNHRLVICIKLPLEPALGNTHTYIPNELGCDNEIRRKEQQIL